MKAATGFLKVFDLESTINRWIDRLAALIREPERAEQQPAKAQLLRHAKGIRTHLIGFLDALEKLIAPSKPDGKQ